MIDVPRQPWQRTPYDTCGVAMPPTASPPIDALMNRGDEPSSHMEIAVPPATAPARYVPRSKTGDASPAADSVTRTATDVAASPPRTFTSPKLGEESSTVTAEVTAPIPAMSKPSTSMKPSSVTPVIPGGNTTPSASVSWITVMRPPGRVQVPQSYAPRTL